MIRTVIRLKSGMVMVFDTGGEPIPEYQGQYEEVRGSILSDAPPDALFTHWFNGNTDPEVTLREGW